MQQICKIAAFMLILLTVAVPSVICCPCRGNIDFSDEPAFMSQMKTPAPSVSSSGSQADVTPTPKPTPEPDPLFAGFFVEYADKDEPDISHPAGNVTVTITISPAETMTLTTDPDGLVDLSGLFETGTPLSVWFTSPEMRPVHGEYTMPGQPGIIAILLS